MHSDLVLASTSPYRAELLAKLGLHFTQTAPICDETPAAGELPSDLVLRLAIAKAQSLQPNCVDDAIIIGSDQVAELNGEIIGKPGNHENAVAQLKRFANQKIVFYTGVCVLRGDITHSRVVPTHVHFRSLNDEQIERYLLADQPYNCAGSFKSESLGIAIAKSMTSDDPTALIGLPLITVAEFLTLLGLPVP